MEYKFSLSVSKIIQPRENCINNRGLMCTNSMGLSLLSISAALEQIMLTSSHGLAQSQKIIPIKSAFRLLYRFQNQKKKTNLKISNTLYSQYTYITIPRHYIERTFPLQRGPTHRRL